MDPNTNTRKRYRVRYPWVETEGSGYIVHYGHKYREGDDREGDDPDPDQGCLYQSDWDWPSAARSIGWDLRRVQIRGSKTIHFARVVKGCEHRSTDGTVKCRECGIGPGQFIQAAAQYLDRRAGAHVNFGVLP